MENNSCILWDSCAYVAYDDGDLWRKCPFQVRIRTVNRKLNIFSVFYANRSRFHSFNVCWATRIRRWCRRTHRCYSDVHELSRTLNLALVIMNLTTPLLDNIGLRKPTLEKKTPALPKAKQFESVTTVDCIRCGECMVVCCHNLSPILIKEVYDKNNPKKLKQL